MSRSNRKTPSSSNQQPTNSSDIAQQGEVTGRPPQAPPGNSVVPLEPAAPPVAKPAAAPPPLSPPPGEKREAPSRPSLTGKEAAPVLVKLPPPFVVGLSQFLWVLSLLAGAVGVVYAFIIRQAQLPDIVELFRNQNATRADQTYTLGADIIFWSVFGALVFIVLLQLWLLVSFANRRPNVRWGQFVTIIVQAGLLIVAQAVIAIGDRGAPLSLILVAQLGLAFLALLMSVLPPALRWTARKHDVRRGPQAPTGGSGL